MAAQGIEVNRNDRPHPSPLPQEREKRAGRCGEFGPPFSHGVRSQEADAGRMERRADRRARPRPKVGFPKPKQIQMRKSRNSKLAMVIALALVSVGASGCFKVSSDAGALRDSVIKSSAAEWDQEIEIGVGAIALTLARTGLAFVDLEPEARAALRAVRSAEVGVYKRRGGHKPLKNTAILRAADRVMNDRGWERIIGVMNRRELVAIYVRGDVRSTRNVKVCLVTVNDHELV